MDEVGRADGAENTAGGSWTRGAKADGADLAERHRVEVGGDFQAVRHLIEADVGALGGEGRMFAETFDEELAAVEEGVVDGGTAEVNASDEVK